MDTYAKRMRKMLGVAFIVGPILYLTAALMMPLGIGVQPAPFDWMSLPEGVIGTYGIIFFIPIYLELARRVGQKQPTYGIVLTVLGLLGGACGVTAMSYRVTIIELLNAGVSPELADMVFRNPGPATLITSIICLFFPLTSILLGIGLFKAEGISKLSAALMIVAGIFFAVAQIGEVAIPITYPIAIASWVIALVPVGLAYLRPSAEMQSSVASAIA